jgi:ATP-binding cassette subfamily F protein 3
MLLSVNGVRKVFGVDVVLDGVTFRLDNREKVALVGRNGAGKTTLLKLITGQHSPDGGSIHLTRGAKIGYLRQEMPITTGRTVLEEAQSAREHQIELKIRLDFLQSKLEDGTASPEDLDEYALVHEHFLDSEGYSAETDVRIILKRLGFKEEEFNKSTQALSGGEKTRLALARLLLEEPDLLILDEPTNHLDLEASEWLEKWVRQYHGAILLVSHDRTFLENTSDRILELREQRVFAYPGPFSKFLQLREEENARLAEVARQQENEIAKMDEYVRRFMNSQRTAQARGREKLMNRLIANKVDAPKNERQMQGGFGTAARSGDLVVTTQKLSVGFPGVDLIKDLDWTVRIGERWGVIGENGAGKSSLIKVVMGELHAKSGVARIGANVTAGYFTQDHSDLDPEESPLDYFVFGLNLKPGEARNLFGRFLITGDDVFRPIKSLSGGEKNKLSLAKLTHLNPNLLVLDEPTNHLDMASRDALIQVLKEFQGTLVMVSHDRHLLTEVVDHILDVRKSGVIQFESGYADYRRHRDTALAGAVQPSQSTQIVAPTRSNSGLTPRELGKEIERREKRILEIENDISRREDEIRSLESRLANVDPSEDILSLSTEYQRAQEALAEVISEWESEHLHLENLQEERAGHSR